ncbi:hypothetical protein BGZ73_000506 [Actinomortierella ambigua]|nr:hypothetical protein BGZ73_000506 [Actinomortierella ambigua]
MPTPENIEMLSIADNSPLLQRTGATQSLFSANSAQVSPSLTRQSSFQSGTSSSSEITKPYDKAKEEDSRFQSWLQSDRANGTLIAPRSDPPEQVQFVRRKAMQDDSTEVGIEASQTNYRLVANYHPVAAGQHKLYLKVKAADSTMPKHRFLARISVYFTVTKMIDTFYASFSASEYDCGPDWYYLKGDGQFEIRGHHETAHVHVSIVMDKKRTDDRLCRLS